MSIIDQCFDNNENFAFDLLKQPAVAFNDIYPLQVARKINCKSFLASQCVQKYLDHQWFGCINYKRTAINFRIFYILFLGLFSFVLLVDYFPLNIYNEYQSEIQILPISITEIILHICFWSFIIEEIRQVI
ncbi:unnamed protein product [Rotaria sordida]|uniref:Transmembrane protein n=1 Tax=Rotaria sordida TaxID=392033 RepID=A0A819JK74_9BILA|nr:unnamed protein product [Rotaria sordida]